MNGYVKSSPHFFRRIKVALVLAATVLLILAVFIPAPLQEPADFSRVPNPSRSAWFLLWTQELVSYSNVLVYLIFFLGLVFCFLPWLPFSPPAQRARWWPKEQWPVSAFTLLCFAGILALTVVAKYFRGINWSFVSPF